MYKSITFRSQRNTRHVIAEVVAYHGHDSWTRQALDLVFDQRCFGLFRYLYPPQMSFSRKICQFFIDLLPLYVNYLYLTMPILLGNAIMMLNCVTTQFRTEPSILILSYLPVQRCDIWDPYFRNGAIVGAAVFLAITFVTCVVYPIWMIESSETDSLTNRVRFGFVSNGYVKLHRAWEATMMARKVIVTVILFFPINLNPAGVTEHVRVSAGLIVTTIFTLFQLLTEPYDKRYSEEEQRIFTHIHICASTRSHIDTETNTDTDRLTDIQTDRQRHTDRHTDRQTDTHTDRQTDRQTHRQTDTQTDTNTDGNTDTNTQTHPQTHKLALSPMWRTYTKRSSIYTYIYIYIYMYEFTYFCFCFLSLYIYIYIYIQKS